MPRKEGTVHLARTGHEVMVWLRPDTIKDAAGTSG
jgi:hypothetical protein